MRTILTLFTTLAFAGSAFAQAAPQSNMAQQLQSLMGSKKAQSNIGQVLALGTLLGCTKKQVGAPATQAFYDQMEAVGKEVETYCKAGHATEARALVLSTLDAKHNDPTVKAALNCYDTNLTSLNSMAGPQAAADAARYANWMKDPAKAKREVSEADVCRKARPVAAAN